MNKQHKASSDKKFNAQKMLTSALEMECLTSSVELTSLT